MANRGRRQIVPFSVMQNNYKDFMNQWKNPHSRFRSYDICKGYFDNHYLAGLNTQAERDEFTIRLFAYLASWGMFRGNDWLLWKCHKVFEPLIDILFDKHYQDLWNIDPVALTFDLDKYCDLTIKLQRALHDMLQKTIDDDDKNFPPIKELIEKEKSKEEHDGGSSGNGSSGIKHNHVSHLMICKIIMGTYGSMIAYDSYDIEGLKALGKNVSKCDFDEPDYDATEKRRLKKTYEIIDNNKQALAQSVTDIKATYNKDYTVFKVLDMDLWWYGATR